MDEMKTAALRPRISMITLGVSDLVRSAAFYRQLGLPQMPSPPTVAFFNLNGSWLGLFPRDRLAADAGISAEPKRYTGGFNNITLSHNVASEVEVDNTLRYVEDCGAAIIKKAQKSDWGGYHGYFADPDGHLWEVAYNPFFWVGPEDDLQTLS